MIELELVVVELVVVLRAFSIVLLEPFSWLLLWRPLFPFWLVPLWFCFVSR